MQKKNQDKSEEFQHLNKNYYIENSFIEQNTINQQDISQQDFTQQSNNASQLSEYHVSYIPKTSSNQQQQNQIKIKEPQNSRLEQSKKTETPQILENTQPQQQFAKTPLFIQNSQSLQNQTKNHRIIENTLPQQQFAKTPLFIQNSQSLQNQTKNHRIIENTLPQQQFAKTPQFIKNSQSQQYQTKTPRIIENTQPQQQFAKTPQFIQNSQFQQNQTKTPRIIENTQPQQQFAKTPQFIQNQFQQNITKTPQQKQVLNFQQQQKLQDIGKQETIDQQEQEIADELYKVKFLRSGIKESQLNSNSKLDIQREEELMHQLQKSSLIRNPHKQFIDEESSRMLRNYKFVQSELYKPSEEKKKIEQESLKNIYEIEQKYNNYQSSSDEYEQDLVRGLLFRLLREQGHQVYITNNKLKYSTAQMFQSQMVFTGQYENIKYFQLKIEDSSNLNYDQIMQNDSKKQEFLEKFIQTASQQYGVSPDQITILGLQKGSILVDHYISGLSNQQIQIFLENQDQFRSVFGQIEFNYKSLLDDFQILPDYFNSDYNMYWDESHHQNIQYRGSLPDYKQNIHKPERYYFPVNYFGYGINVQKWLEEEKQWFGTSSDKNVWIVLFHGTNKQGFIGINNSYIKPGYFNAYENSICRLTGKEIPDGQYQNTYLSNKVEEAAQYSINRGGVYIGDQNYILVFQCRVNPEHVQSPEDNPEYYTVYKDFAQESIRPYRILIKSMK